MTGAGWRHVVVGTTGVEGESLWNIAEWFTGSGANYVAIRKANPAQGLSTRKGDVILIPKELLAAAFRGGVEGTNAPKTAEVRKSEDDPVEHAPADADAAAPPAEAVALGQPSLSYDRNAAEPFAVYRLQRGEALYSSVAIRFTGRVYSNDVGDVLDRLVKFNAIDGVFPFKPLAFASCIALSLSMKSLPTGSVTPFCTSRVADLPPLTVIVRNFLVLGE